MKPDLEYCCIFNMPMGYEPEEYIAIGTTPEKAEEYFERDCVYDISAQLSLEQGDQIHAEVHLMDDDGELKFIRKATFLARE